MVRTFWNLLNLLNLIKFWERISPLSIVLELGLFYRLHLNLPIPLLITCLLIHCYVWLNLYVMASIPVDSSEEYVTHFDAERLILIYFRYNYPSKIFPLEIINSRKCYLHVSQFSPVYFSVHLQTALPCSISQWPPFWHSLLAHRSKKIVLRKKYIPQAFF